MRAREWEGKSLKSPQKYPFRKKASVWACAPLGWHQYQTSICLLNTLEESEVILRKGEVGWKREKRTSQKT